MPDPLRPRAVLLRLIAANSLCHGRTPPGHDLLRCCERQLIASPTWGGHSGGWHDQQPDTRSIRIRMARPLTAGRSRIAVRTRRWGRRKEPPPLSEGHGRGRGRGRNKRISTLRPLPLPQGEGEFSSPAPPYPDAYGPEPGHLPAAHHPPGRRPARTGVISGIAWRQQPAHSSTRIIEARSLADHVTFLRLYLVRYLHLWLAFCIVYTT